MLAASVPTKIQLPFASTGTKNTIPVPSQISITPGAASYTDGFPPLTFTPLAAGGIPPDGADFNGIFNAITSIQQWQSAGGIFKYDSAFSTAIGGYPAGAILLSTDGVTRWLNLVDSNTLDPDGGSAGGTWLSLGNQNGITTVSGLAAANVTLTSSQYKNKTIILAGTLTANIQIIFPATLQKWQIINNTTGLFTVTCKTAAGTGIVVSGMQDIYGDGTNIVAGLGDSRNSIAVQGAFKNLQASSTGLNANISVTVDEILVENGSNLYQTLRNVSLTINSAASGVNGLSTGTLAGSTWYAVWVWWNGTTACGTIDPSATTPTAPAAGYTHKARVGWIRTDGTANKYPLSFKQYGRRVQYVVASGSNVASLPQMAAGVTGSLSTPTWVAVAVGAFIPITASRISGVLASGDLSGAMVAPNNSYGAYNSTTNPPPCSGNWSANESGYRALFDFAVESSNIYWATYVAPASQLYCFGWEDNL